MFRGRGSKCDWDQVVVNIGSVKDQLYGNSLLVAKRMRGIAWLDLNLDSSILGVKIRETIE
jgi:hypothetical protein